MREQEEAAAVTIAAAAAVAVAVEWQCYLCLYLLSPGLKASACSVSASLSRVR